MSLEQPATTEPSAEGVDRVTSPAARAERIYVPLVGEVFVSSAQEAIWHFMGKPDAVTAAGMPSVEETRTARHTPLHALIIGINEYKSKRIKPLNGAVPDADAMDEYLRTDLQVPESQIVNLRNAGATRSRILHELKALRKRDIRKDDPILIYYAGHGASAHSPTGWSDAEGSRISMLVPHDCLIRDGEGKEIQGIPDRTIGALLHGLAEQKDGTGKGDNITVIFDCCHSGSGTRDADSAFAEPARKRQDRGFVLKDPVDPDLDREIWSKVPQDRAIAVAAGFAKSGAQSHVLLAACKEKERAHEEDGRGDFTRVLLQTLRGVAADKLTYRELIDRLPDIPNQIPQCEGYNANRVIFNSLAPSKGQSVYPVAEKDGKMIMDAGSIHGITTNAHFDLYTKRDFTTSDAPLATVTTKDVKAFTTEVSFVKACAFDASEGTPAPKYFAFQRTMGDAESVRLHIPLMAGIGPVFEALAEELKVQPTGSHAILYAEDAKSAHLGIYMNGNEEIEYLLLDPVIAPRGLHKLYYTTAAEAHLVRPVIHSASNFFWHLHRAPQKNQLRSRIAVEVKALEEDESEDAEVDDDLRGPLTPFGDNLNQAGVIDVVADGATRYGVIVSNKSNVPLHLWAFYFDCSDLSITEYYRSPVTGVNAEAPLPANGTLSLGYGSGGGLAYEFYLRKNPTKQERDVGFIKLFISTEAVDLESIAQPTPFGQSPSDAMERMMQQEAKPKPKPIWDTVTIAVVQRSPDVD